MATMSSDHNEYNHDDLLDFLMSASYQLKGLLDLRHQPQQASLLNEEQKFYLNSKVFYENLTNNVTTNFNGSRLSNQLFSSLNCMQESCWSSSQQQYHCETSQIAAGFVSSDAVLEPQHHQREVYSSSNNNSNNSTNYETHHYVPSTSTNFVDLTQYSAKPPQRQDTGYAWREVNASVPSSSNNTTTTATTNAAAIVVMPPPSLQEYQPECAYCCWLAKGFVD